MERSYIQKSNIVKFYKSLKFTDYKLISNERRIELDILADKWRYFFVNQCNSFLTLMTFLSEKMLVGAKNYGLQNDDEIAYFYVNILDPELKILEIHETCNTVEEEKKMYMSLFYTYDKNLLFLEQRLNQRFQKFDEEEMWVKKR